MMIKSSGINGFDVPSIPKAPRSARRTTSKKKLEDHQVCAFDLLAAVAGKLLQEKENSSASSNFVIDQDAVKLEQQSTDRVSDTTSFSKKDSVVLDEHLSALSTSDGSDNVETDLRIGISVRTDVQPKMFNKMKTTHHCGGSSDNATGFEIIAPVQDEGPKTGELLHNNSLPSLENKFPCSPDLHHKRSVKFVSREDDQKYISRCSKSSKVKTPHTGNIRVRKFSGYKYWKVSPKLRYHDSCAGKLIKSQSASN